MALDPGGSSGSSGGRSGSDAQDRRKRKRKRRPAPPPPPRRGRSDASDRRTTSSPAKAGKRVRLEKKSKRDLIRHVLELHERIEQARRPQEPFYERDLRELGFAEASKRQLERDKDVAWQKKYSEYLQRGREARLSAAPKAEEEDDPRAAFLSRFDPDYEKKRKEEEQWELAAEVAFPDELRETMGPSSIASNFKEEAQSFARGAPGAVYSAGRAGVGDARRVIEDPLSFLEDQGAVKREVIDPYAGYVKKRYIDPFQERGLVGGAEQIGAEMQEKPLSGLLDLWAAGGLANIAKVGGKVGGRTRNLHVQPESSKGYYAHPSTSPNYLTEIFQHAYDRFSEATGGAVSRGEKWKAKDIAREQDRAKGQASPHARRIQHISFGHLQNKKLRRLLRWEAELPPTHRTVEGLQAVLANLQGYRAKVDKMKGEKGVRARRKLNVRIRAVEQAIETKRTMSNRDRKHYEAAVESARFFTREREAILLDVYGPDILPILRNRRALVAEQLFGEGTPPSDIFLGHKADMSTTAIRRSRIGGGALQPGKSRMTKKNEMKLWAMGRTRLDPDVIIEDWSVAQSLRHASMIKEHFRDISVPLVDGTPNPGWYLSNPAGKSPPKRWGDVDETNPDTIISVVQDYVQSFLAREDKPEANVLRERAEAAGDEIRQIDPAIVRKFYNRFVGPQGTAAGAGGPLVAWDVANGIVKLSLLYGNPAYYPANLAGALIFAGLHQGPFLPINLVRAGMTILKDKERSALVRAEVGEGATLSLTTKQMGRRSVGKDLLNAERAFAQRAHTVADLGPRMAAWYFEARKANFKTREQQMDLLTNPARKTDRDQINALVQDAMVDFGLLGPAERGILGRMFFVWPWIRGASKWAVRWPLDRPIRADLLYNAAGRFDAANPLQEGVGMPLYLDQAFQTDPEQRGNVRQIVNPSSFSTVGTPFEVPQRVAGGEGLLSLINPLLNLGFRTAGKEIEHQSFIEKVEGEGLKPFLEAFAEGGKGMTPLATLIDDILHPPESDIYADQSRGGIAKRRLLRGYPLDLKIKGARASAKREEPGDEGRTATILKEDKERRAKWEKFYGKDKVPAPITFLLDARVKTSQREDKFKEHHDVKKLTDYQRLGLRYKLAMELYPKMESSRSKIESFIESAKGNEERIDAGLRIVNKLLGYYMRAPGS